MYLSHYYCCSQNTLYNEQLFNIQFHLMERKWRKVKSRKKEGKTCLISCSPLWACIESEVRESVGHGWLLFYLHPPVDFSVIYGMLSCFFVNCIAAPFPFYVSLVAPTKAESLGFKSHPSKTALWDCFSGKELLHFLWVCLQLYPPLMCFWDDSGLQGSCFLNMQREPKTRPRQCLVKTMHVGFHIFVSMQLINLCTFTDDKQKDGFLHSVFWNACFLTPFIQRICILAPHR